MPTNVIMPQMGESVAEGTITKWMKRVGDRVERDEPLFEITTDKVDAEIPSPAAGVLTGILVKENETVAVNTVVAVIDGAGSAEAAAPATVPRKQKEPSSGREDDSRPAAQPKDEPVRAVGKGHSSPLVRRIAEENHVDLSQVRGTGLGGRVSKKDVLDYIEARGGGGGGVPSRFADETRAASGSARTGPSRPAEITFTTDTQIVPMTPMRRQIAEHMAASKRTSAHVHTVFEVEMTRVAEIRARIAAEFEKRHGLKLTYTPFFIRAAIHAIAEFPILNSSVEGANIVYKRDVNIGVAVALETGLIVPVIRKAGDMSFLGVARAVQDLAERARSKRLSVDEVKDGTFTITNHGIFGSLFGIPIINQPQVAILGVGTIEKRPVVREDAIAIRPMVYLALSFDHRIIDGAVADQFMARIKSGLENWDEALL